MAYLKQLAIITKKELKAYFDHPVAYIILVAFIAINSFFYFRSAFIYNVAEMRYMFNVFLWLFLFIVPAITMRLVSEEKQNHTLELLFAQPIREWVVLVGKFLAGLVFIAIILLLTLLIPLLLSHYGQFDWGMVLAQYIGALLLSMLLVAIGIFSSSLTKNQIVAFMLSVVIIFVLLAVGLNMVLVSVPSFLKTILEQLSLGWHYFNIIRGVIDARDVIYFLTATAAFLSVSYWLVIRDNINPKRAVWRQLKIGILALVGIIIVINLLGLNIHGRIDLTKQKIYTLSPATKSIVSNLSDVVTIDYYFSKELPSEVSVRSRDVADLLLDFEVVSKGKLKVVKHEVDANNSTDAESAGIQPVQFNTLKSDEFQVKKGYFGLAISYLDKKEVIPFIKSSNDFEYRVVRLIKKLITDKKLTVGFLSGHGEKSYLSDYSTFNQALSDEFDVSAVTLNSDTGEFDSKPDILIVAGPKDEMTDKEKDSLKSFINSGGKVMFLIDAVDIDMKTLRVTENKDSLANLVSDFGVRVNSDIVGDLRSHENISLGQGIFSYIMPYPFWPRLVGSGQSVITNEISSLPMPWSSSLSVLDSQLKIIPLLETTEYGFTQESNYNLTPDQKFDIPRSNLGKKIVAMSVSAENDGTQSVSDIRLIVVGDSDFLTEDFVKSNPKAVLFAMNAVDWLAQDEGLISIRSKQREAPSLVFKKDSQKNFVKYANLLGLPLLVSVFGAIYIYRRKKITKRVYKSN